MVTPTAVQLVTPEGVLLELEPAGLPSRSISFVVDLLVQLGALLVLVIAVAGVSAATGRSLPPWVGIVIASVAVFGILFGYPCISETAWRGRTIGKRLVGVRAVTVEGAPVRFRHAAIRAALGLVDFYIVPGGMAACLSVLFSRDNQRLGDRAAGTLVVRERTAAAQASAVWFPPPWRYEAYTASLDVSALTGDDYARARGFLLRAAELAPNARDHLALQIANPLAEKLRHRPPAPVTPELFLACVAAAYQQRQAAAQPFAPRAPGLLPPPNAPAAPVRPAEREGEPPAGTPPPATPSPGGLAPPG